MLVSAEPIMNLPCFQIGYAVSESMRGQGIATMLVGQAILEFKHGLKRTPIKQFYLEAIVPLDNVASNKIARKYLTDSPKSIKDDFSQTPSLQYICKVQLA